MTRHRLPGAPKGYTGKLVKKTTIAETRGRMVYVRRKKRAGSWVPPAGSGEVVVEMLPRLDNILLNSYAQLLATVEELKGLEDELQREFEAQRQLLAKQGGDSREDLEDAGDFVKEQKEFKELTTGDMAEAKEWLQQQGSRRFRNLY